MQSSHIAFLYLMPIHTLETSGVRLNPWFRPQNRQLETSAYSRITNIRFACNHYEGNVANCTYITVIRAVIYVMKDLQRNATRAITQQATRNVSPAL